MKILLFAVALLLIAFAIHLVVWRIRVPRQPYLVLLALFTTVMLTGMMAASALPSLQHFAPGPWWQWVHVSLFYMVLACAYIIFYSTLEADSPSTSIVKFVELGGAQGRARTDIQALITDDILLKSRLRSLLNEGLARHEGECFRLTPKGHVWANLFTLWMKILNIPRGGG